MALEQKAQFSTLIQFQFGCECSRLTLGSLSLPERAGLARWWLGGRGRRLGESAFGGNELRALTGKREADQLPFALTALAFLDAYASFDEVSPR